MSVPAQEPLDPVFEVFGVFSNRNLLSTSGRQPRAVAVACIVLAASWTTVTNNSKEGFSCPVLGSLLDGIWILEGSLLAYMRKFYVNYIQTYSTFLFW